jgi:hypothetical protein
MSFGFLLIAGVLYLVCQRFQIIGLLVLGMLPVSVLGGLLHVFWTGQMWLYVGLWCLMVFVVFPCGVWVQRRVSL